MTAESVFPSLPAEARTALDAYLARLSEALPGAYQGVYLTGSAALGDWQPGRSDMDLLTVTNRRLDSADLDALAALHAGSAGRPHLDALYVHCDVIGKAAPADGPGVPYTVDGVFHRAGLHPDPVLWATLDWHGLAAYGPPAGQLGASPDPGWLREWNLGNLESYWQPFAADTRERLAGRDPDSTIMSSVAVWVATGPGRLHHTIATGGIISKTGAADYTAKLFPQYAELLDRAKAWRLGDDTVTFTAADGLATCDLADVIIEDAGRLDAR